MIVKISNKQNRSTKLNESRQIPLFKSFARSGLSGYWPSLFFSGSVILELKTNSIPGMTRLFLKIWTLIFGGRTNFETG